MKQRVNTTAVAVANAKAKQVNNAKKKKNACDTKEGEREKVRF